MAFRPTFARCGHPTGTVPYLDFLTAGVIATALFSDLHGIQIILTVTRAFGQADGDPTPRVALVAGNSSFAAVGRRSPPWWSPCAGDMLGLLRSNPLRVSAHRGLLLGSAFLLPSIVLSVLSCPAIA